MTNLQVRYSNISQHYQFQVKYIEPIVAVRLCFIGFIKVVEIRGIFRHGKK